VKQRTNHKDTYLVTGGAGFIGSHTAEALAADGCAVRVLDNFHTGRRKNLRAVAGKIDLRKGDICDRRDVRDAMRGVDYVIHLAALVSVTESVENPQATLAVNIDGTLNVLSAARAAGVRRVVLASSCAVYGDGPVPARETQAPQPLSPYAVSKLALEGLAQSFFYTHGLETVCLRYFNVYGPRQAADSPYSGVIAIFVDRILAGQTVTIYGDGGQTRDFIYVDDVARANVLACTAAAAAGQVVNLGTGRGRNLKELHALLRSLAGGRSAPQFAAARAGDIYHSRCDAARARKLLGFQPQTDFRAGLEKTLAGRRTEPEAVSA
jgi:nucleoside-diphosphate-sugar epimerase